MSLSTNDKDDGLKTSWELALSFDAPHSFARFLSNILWLCWETLAHSLDKDWPLKWIHSHTTDLTRSYMWMFQSKAGLSMKKATSSLPVWDKVRLWYCEIRHPRCHIDLCAELASRHKGKNSVAWWNKTSSWVSQTNVKIDWKFAEIISSGRLDWIIAAASDFS